MGHMGCMGEEARYVIYYKPIPVILTRRGTLLEGHVYLSLKHGSCMNIL